MLYDKLLISDEGFNLLFIYSREGHHLLTIRTNDNDQLYDATWTPKGKIVYATCNNNKVVVMSESGKGNTTTHTHLRAKYFSISSDNIIYLATMQSEVYQSRDDGISWSLAFNSPDGWRCWQVIKMSTRLNSKNDFWALAQSMYYTDNLCVFSVDRRHSDGNVTWRDVNVTAAYNEQINLTPSRLEYDGNMNVFVGDWYKKAVHVFSAKGQYQCQLMSSHHIKNRPERLAFDKERQLLYVGQGDKVVEMFKLTYGNEDSCSVGVAKFSN